MVKVALYSRLKISIHSLRMEGDGVSELPVKPVRIAFQSTPSAWRETERNGCATIPLNHFNPLPPHGGRLGNIPPYGYDRKISIHSLRMEGDTDATWFCKPLRHFNPLPPHGGRQKSETQFWKNLYFNPLPPHGGRLRPCCRIHRVKDFNPLPPHGGRPGLCGRLLRRLSISIHSLRMEGDRRR